MANALRLLTFAAWGCIAGAALPPSVLAADKDPDPVLSNPATAHELPQITVIGNAPLSGLGLPLNYVPSTVQTADSRDMQRQQSLGLADFLNNNFSGISSSENSDNPLQPDINYHGFTASPLLGTPEGLSVYVDGVRVNESFGDTVNWDLIPQSAISTITLQSGSNPIFGLNTLGGALVVQTKSGHDNPGTEIEASAGSFGRRSLEAETGGEFGHFDYFLTADYFDENGWRDLSPTRVYQVFAKAGWSNDKTDFDLSYTYADSSLIGNGSTPQSLLDHRYASIYSAPDFTHNLLDLINANATQYLSESLLLSGNAYFRQLVTGGNNGDVNTDNYLTAGYDGPAIDCGAPLVTLRENSYCSNAINRAARLTQRTTGFSAQLTDSQDVFELTNQAVFGVNYDHSTDTYVQSFQYATLTPERTAIANSNTGNPSLTVNSLSGINQIMGVYLTDTLSPNSLLHVTASVRYNRSHETLNGYSVDTAVADAAFNQPHALGEDHVFIHVNPAFGFTVTPHDELTLFASYNQSSRSPTVIELGCSDPANPCGLPNAFASDPNLKQVISHTVEAGARGSLAHSTVNWSADVFRTINRDDIQFISATTSQGYFDNVGNTRRQGLDLAIGGKYSKFSWHAVYSFVDATYQSAFDVNGGSNSTANGSGNIRVAAGNRIPLIPRHTGRLMLDCQVTDNWDIGGNIIAAAASFLHGNENNANQAGATNVQGSFIAGSGRIGGYTVVNLHSTYHIGKTTDVFLRIVNVMNRRYATAGFLKADPFDPTGAFRANPNDWSGENAVSPAQPRAVWAGVRLRF